MSRPRDAHLRTEKFCSGPCGRELSLEAFDFRDHGRWRQSICRACARVKSRERMRRKKRAA